MDEFTTFESIFKILYIKFFFFFFNLFIKSNIGNFKKEAIIRENYILLNIKVLT